MLKDENFEINKQVIAVGYGRQSKGGEFHDTLRLQFSRFEMVTVHRHYLVYQNVHKITKLCTGKVIVISLNEIQ